MIPAWSETHRQLVLGRGYITGRTACPSSFARPSVVRPDHRQGFATATISAGRRRSETEDDRSRSSRDVDHADD